jgi:opacity protein-like surface antigen
MSERSRFTGTTMFRAVGLAGVLAAPSAAWAQMEEQAPPPEAPEAPEAPEDVEDFGPAAEPDPTLTPDPALPPPGPPAETAAPQIFGMSGIAVYGGLGFATFAEGDMNDLTDLGGAWTLGVRINTRGTVGLEVQYVGSSQDIDALGLDSDARILGTMIEARARAEIFDIQGFRPFVHGGVGFAHYDLSGASFNTSNVQSEENMISVPLGAGVAYRFDRILVDAQLTYRLMLFDSMVEGGPGQASAGQDNWTTLATIGYEF